eukprot:1395319-Amorphochlora_amoeboformis.AAC.1
MSPNALTYLLFVQEMREIIEKELERRSKSIFESETDEQFVNRVKETRTALLPVTGRFEAPPVVWIAAHGNVEALSAIFEYSPSSIGAKDKVSIIPINIYTFYT